VRRSRRILCLILASDCRRQFPPMFYRYLVYMIQSSSRRALYIGFTNFLILRVIEHRRCEYPGSFISKYRAWRLVYYEEFGDTEAAKDRERQLKGWSRAKKNALVAKMNPKWRDLISEWENKYGPEFRLDGRIVEKQSQQQIQDPSTPASLGPRKRAGPSCAQDWLTNKEQASGGPVPDLVTALIGVPEFPPYSAW